MSPTGIRILVLFVAAYAGFVLFPSRKAAIALAAAVLAFLLSPLPLPAFLQGVNPNILGLVAGTLVLSDLFVLSRVPEVWADEIIDRSPNVGVAALGLCLATGAVSIVLENVAALLLLAPVAFSFARKARIDPIPLLVGMTLSSNLQGTATLIGDPPSMIMAGYERMTFNDFFFFRGRPSIFWFVQAGAVAAAAVLWLFLRKATAGHRKVDLQRGSVRSWIPAVFLGLLVVSLAVASRFDPENRWLAGTLCVLLALGGLLWSGLSGFARPRNVLQRLDKDTLVFLAGVFLLVAAFERTGFLESLSRLVARLAAGRPFFAFHILLWFSVFVSAFVDNVPYVTVMLPVAASLAAALHVPRPLFVFATVLGACVGGNITPFGATANIVAAGLLRKEGRPVSVGGFVRIGLPFTLAAVSSASLLLWLVWSR